MYLTVFYNRKVSSLLVDKMKIFLCSTQRIRKKYENRNMLRLCERDMFEDVCPEHARDDILNKFCAKTQCVYAGFDPTASSLHIGNLLILINLLHWQRSGHQVIALVGGATAQIGDPSGRTKDRQQQEKLIIKENAIHIAQNIKDVFANHETYIWNKVENNTPLKPVIILNNEEWYARTDLIDFISTIGIHFRMNKMLLKESVAKRLESERGMSFTEFTYQIFQSYDWLYLLQNYNCSFQIGGKDQLGNIISGRTLIDRHSDRRVFGFTLPLITTDAGDKFGKSVPNAVWLNSKLTSPFDLYQFFLRTEDDDVERFLKFFTFDTIPEINKLMSLQREEPHKRIAQTRLAEEITLLVHGENGLNSAKQTTSLLYNNDIEALSKLSLDDASNVFPGAVIVKLLLKPGYTVLQLALEAACFLNEADAHRVIDAGGFYINYKRVTNVTELLTNSVHILPNRISLLRVGKRNYWIVKWT